MKLLAGLTKMLRVHQNPTGASGVSSAPVLLTVQEPACVIAAAKDESIPDMCCDLCFITLELEACWKRESRLKLLVGQENDASPLNTIWISVEHLPLILLLVVLEEHSSLTVEKQNERQYLHAHVVRHKCENSTKINTGNVRGGLWWLQLPDMCIVGYCYQRVASWRDKQVGCTFCKVNIYLKCTIGRGEHLGLWGAS